MLTDDQIVLYQLAFAKQKLLTPHIPLCLKAISYGGTNVKLHQFSTAWFYMLGFPKHIPRSKVTGDIKDSILIN